MHYLVKLTKQEMDAVKSSIHLSISTLQQIRARTGSQDGDLVGLLLDYSGALKALSTAQEVEE